MFSDDRLHYIRSHELSVLATHLPVRCRLLELGAGTGYQAQKLSEMGHDVSAIDLAQSRYSEARVFQVSDYDGKHIPFPDGTFDVVFSSNVLEHVTDLGALLADIRRVLKPGGYCVHAMPTTAFRVWSDLGGPVDMLNVFGTGRTMKQLAGAAWARVKPTRHGELGNAFTEYWHFRKARWIRDFERNGFDVVSAEPMKFLYSGWMIFGQKFSTQARRRAADVLGSSCRVYVVKPHVTRLPMSRT